MVQYFVLLALALALVACGETETQQEQPAESATTGTAEILVDETLYDLLQPTFAMFDSAYPDAHVTVTPVSAHEAFRRLLADSTRGVIVARSYLRVEDSLMKAFQVTRPEPMALAQDALVLYVRKDFPLDTVSLDQLKQVLADGASLQSMFPGLASEPVFISPDVTSSVYGNVLNLLTGGRAPQHNMRFVASQQEVRREVLSAGNAIGIGYLSFVARDTAGIRALRIGFADSTGRYISPKTVHQAFVYMGTYPLPVPIHGIMAENLRNTLPWGFFSFLGRNGQTQEYFLKQGIVPAFAKIRLVQPE